MPTTKTHTRKKRSRLRGSKTAFWGARKKHKKSGHRGGKGLSGTGKRSGQKTTLVNKLYGNKYFGKQGVTSRSTQKDKRDRINVAEIFDRLAVFEKKGIAMKTKDGFEVNLETYKVLGTGNVEGKKEKLIIKAKEASKSAIEKVKKSGGEIVLPVKKKIETKKVETKPKVKEEKKAEKKVEVKEE
jgi:large subunit ribosomal protein L15